MCGNKDNTISEQSESTLAVFSHNFLYHDSDIVHIEVTSVFHNTVWL